MSFENQIGVPFTLASLPRPISSTGGRTQAAGVCSISGTKKRKRTEVAVGVDGEGILVYSLQNPQLVTSYALPPQTSFATAPYSLYRKSTFKRSSFRFTYAAVTQSVSGEKPQILCFTEEVRRDGTTDTNKTSYTISDRSQCVVAIDSFPVAGDSTARSGSHDVLVVFQSGRVLCLSSDLKTERWAADLGALGSHDSKAKSQDELTVEHVTITTAKATINGLLRSREDIAALLDPSPDRNAEALDLTHVLCVISRRSAGETNLDLYQLQPRAPDLIPLYNIPLKHLLAWKLPQQTSKPSSTSGSSMYYLHTTSGILHQLANGRCISYDLTGNVPKIYSDFEVQGLDINSFLRLSPDLIFATSRQSWGIFDVKYSSVQALLPFESNNGLTNYTKKRKQADQELLKQSDTAPTLVAHFAEVGLAVAIINNELAGIPIAGTIANKRSKSNSTSTLLIDSIGKGIPSGTHGSAIGALSEASPQWQSWRKRVQKLDKYASKGKVADFERLLAAELGIELAHANAEENDNSLNPQLQLQNGSKTPPLTNGVNGDTAMSQDVSTAGNKDNHSDGQLQKWNLTQGLPNSGKHTHQHQALYALSKIFSLVTSQSLSEKQRHQSSLKIEFFPPNVFQWLLLSGYLTKESIRRSVLNNSPDHLDVLATISDGDIIKAIVEFDPDLHILSAVLNHSQFLPACEVVQAIRVLMQSLEDQDSADAVSGLLTNGAVQSEDEMQIELASELDAATHDLDHALSILENGLLIRSHTLRPALIRLHTFPTLVITSTLRQMLHRHELESLIRLLHSQMRNGGWTLSYIDSEMSSTETFSESPDDQAVAIIASLLSCALDAIGAGPWLASVSDSASEESAADMIHDLFDDTTEALKGFWEVRFMRGLLSQFLRYASDLSKTQKPTTKSLQKQGKPFAVEAESDEALRIMPLGGKIDLGVEKMKMGKRGKREERSAREIGMMISKRVPKYSFERVVI